MAGFAISDLKGAIRAAQALTPEERRAKRAEISRLLAEARSGFPPHQWEHIPDAQPPLDTQDPQK